MYKTFFKKELQYKVASFVLFHAKKISYTEQPLRGNIILRVIKLHSASLLMYRPSTVQKAMDTTTTVKKIRLLDPDVSFYDFCLNLRREKN